MNAFLNDLYETGQRCQVQLEEYEQHDRKVGLALIEALKVIVFSNQRKIAESGKLQLFISFYPNSLRPEYELQVCPSSELSPTAQLMLQTNLLVEFERIEVFKETLLRTDRPVGYRVQLVDCNRQVTMSNQGILLFDPLDNLIHKDCRTTSAQSLWIVEQQYITGQWIDVKSKLGPFDAAFEHHLKKDIAQHLIHRPCVLRLCFNQPVLCDAISTSVRVVQYNFAPNNLSVLEIAKLVELLRHKFGGLKPFKIQFDTTLMQGNSSSSSCEMLHCLKNTYQGCATDTVDCTVDFLLPQQGNQPEPESVYVFN